jgi:hypothetical protein
MARVVLLLVVIILSVGLAAAASAVALGEEAPDFSLPDVFTQNQIRLSDYRGEVVVLVFFAWW